MDCYYSIDAWPVRSQDGFITDEKMMAGGCAVNMAATIKNLGGLPVVISGMGNDSMSDSLMEYMNENSLSTKLIKRCDGTIGKCLVFLEPDGERTFLTGKGAEGFYTDELDELVRAEIPAVAGVTGYYLLNDDAERIMDTIEYLHSQGTKVLFDPSPLVSSIDDAILERIIKVSEIMTPNTVELAVIEKYTTLEDYVNGGRTAVVKSGGTGGTVYTRDESFEYTAAEVSAVIDTTGAGDSFAGALLYSMMENIPVREAIDLAARCAARTVEIEGPHGFWSL